MPRSGQPKSKGASLNKFDHVHLLVNNLALQIPMADPQDWSIDSNEAVELALLNPLASNPLTFHPDYTYPIFGDAETLYGYKDLSINLSFTGWDMRGYLKVSWRQRINPALGLDAEDVKKTLKEYLPEGEIFPLAAFRMES